MFQYLIQSFRRKKARRFFQEYPYQINRFELETGTVEFANWQNPLTTPKAIGQENVDFFKKFVKNGDLVIDIGANIGHMTVAMALAAGKEGQTLAFDPNPHVFKILEVNAGLNPALTNIRALNYAITDEEAEFFYYSSEASFNNGGISKQDTDKHGRFALPTKVRGIVLERLLEAQFPDRLSRLALIKIDTEGYDKEIIRSIRGLLRRFKPVVITECFSKTTPEERAEQFGLLADLGYKLFHIEGFNSSTLMTLINNAGDMNKWKHFDIVALNS
ncbi:MAG: FkbM family methyltransferase [Thermoanaerobaculia bacterium]|nr:FkbM family methyltransferase [Thermoanaerobaculia bacterium]